jgi:hypothetical protein
VIRPYVQVALTYPRGIGGRLAVTGGPLGLLLAAGLLVVLFGLNVRNSLVLILLLSFTLADHVREQFSNCRSRLVPCFARVHLVVAAFTVLIAGVVVPAWLAWLTDSNLVGFLAISLFMSGVMLLAGSFEWIGWLAAFALYVGIAASSDDAVRWISRPFGQLISGQAPGVAATLFGLGGLMIFLTWRRLVRFNEEMLGYGRAIQTGVPEGRGMWTYAPGRVSRLLLAVEGWNQEREVSRVTRHARHASASAWSRRCRWQVDMVASRSAWFWAFGSVLALQFLFWAVYAGSNGERLLFFISFIWPVLVPALSLAGLSERKQSMCRDLMLPVDRRTYLKQLGESILLAQFQLWSAAGAATLVWWLIAARQAVSAAVVASLLTLSAGLQFTVFGGVLWIARYPAVLFLFIPIALIPAVTLLCAPGIEEHPYAALAAAAVLLAVLTVLMIRSAYRRWLVMDFD